MKTRTIRIAIAGKDIIMRPIRCHGQHQLLLQRLNGLAIPELGQPDEAALSEWWGHAFELWRGAKFGVPELALVRESDESGKRVCWKIYRDDITAAELLGKWEDEMEGPYYLDDNTPLDHYDPCEAPCLAISQVIG